MSREDFIDVASMSLAEIVKRHERDLYRGNGKPGITTRLSELESYRERTESDLYGDEKGIIPRLTEFFAVVRERENKEASTLKHYMLILSAVAVGTPILWDLWKHVAGWAK